LYIYGTRNKWFQPAGVIFGSPVEISDGANYEEVAAKVKEAIENIKNL
jgi:hypothetical protein